MITLCTKNNEFKKIASLTSEVESFENKERKSKAEIENLKKENAKLARQIFPFKIQNWIKIIGIC